MMNDSEIGIFPRSSIIDNIESGQQVDQGNSSSRDSNTDCVLHRPFIGMAIDDVLHDPIQQQTMQRISPGQEEQSVWTRRLIVVGLASCILFVIVDSFGDRRVEAAFLKFLQWVQDHPFQGAVLVTAVYIVATVLFVPGSILSLGAGFAIGSAFQNRAVGVLLATTAIFIGASIGSILSFLLGRYLFRDCVLRLAATYTIFQAVDRALEGNGLKIMILLRLSPLIPYNALDYMSGVTSISLRDYSLALIALLPGALMIAFVGASASSLTDTTSNENKTLKIITIVSGILFGGLGIFAASYYSKQELDRLLASDPASSLMDDEGSAELLANPPISSSSLSMSVREGSCPERANHGDDYSGDA